MYPCHGTFLMAHYLVAYVFTIFGIDSMHRADCWPRLEEVMARVTTGGAALMVLVWPVQEAMHSAVWS